MTTATRSAPSTASTPCSVARRSAANVPIPQARGGYVETIAVRTRYLYLLGRTDTSRMVRSGCCDLSRIDALPRQLPVPARSRSSKRLKNFLVAVLPLSTLETWSGGLVWESTRER